MTRKARLECRKLRGRIVGDGKEGETLLDLLYFFLDRNSNREGKNNYAKKQIKNISLLLR